LLEGLNPVSEKYADELKSVYDAAEAGWPPPISSAITTRVIFGTTAGLSLFLSLVLRNNSEEECDALAPNLTVDELSAIERVAWGIEENYREAIIKRIDAHLGFPDLVYEREEGDGRPISWEKAVGDTVTNTSWATPERIGDLTLSQWRLVRMGGEEEEASDPLPADHKIREEVLAARRGFFGVVIGESMPTLNVQKEHDSAASDREQTNPPDQE
jgi:hypothetical protein